MSEKVKSHAKMQINKAWIKAYYFLRCHIAMRVEISTSYDHIYFRTVILQFFMMIFSILRSGNISFLTTRSKFSIFFFLLSVNIYLAQLWADTCRKFSPIEYLECVYIQVCVFGKPRYYWRVMTLNLIHVITG